MATAALLTARPFAAIANGLSPVTGFSINNNSLVLAHTGNAAAGNQTLQQIAKLKNSNANLLMLHAGSNAPVVNNGRAVYDASMQNGTSFSINADDYKIVYKGNIKTGIITADSKKPSAEKINALAIYLKKEKDCHLVVCLSQLGYKSKTGLDDLSLAAASTHLDVIIGGHVTNFCKSPMTTLNKNKEEVIINHAGTNGLAFRKIEIGFDNRGRKNQLAFTRSCLQA